MLQLKYFSQLFPLFSDTMAQAIIRRHLTANSRVRARFSPCGIFGRQSGTGTRYSPSSLVLPCQYPPWLSILKNHLGNEQWWPQFRDVVSPHWHEQHCHFIGSWEWTSLPWYHRPIWQQCVLIQASNVEAIIQIFIWYSHAH